MVAESIEMRASISQWASIGTVAIAAAGVLWGAVGYVDKFALRLENMDDRLTRIEKTLDVIDGRSRADHDKLIDLQAQVIYLRRDNR